MTTYGFLTTNNTIIEIKAKSPKEGKGKAKERLIKLQSEYAGTNIEEFSRGEITDFYMTYGRDGMSTGIYKKVKY